MQYPFDPTGMAASNKVTNERHTMTQVSAENHNYIVLDAAPFYSQNFSVWSTDLGRFLEEDVDFEFTHKYEDAKNYITNPLYGSITLLDKSATGTLAFEYQTLGGEFATTANAAIENGLATLQALRNTLWENIADRPATFPPTPHLLPITSIEAVQQLIDGIQLMTQAVAAPNYGLVLSDIADVDTALLGPLFSSLEAIKIAIEGRTYNDRVYTEVSSDYGENKQITNVSAGTWTQIPLVTTALVDGSYTVDWDLRLQKDGMATDEFLPESEYSIRFKINDEVNFRSYTRKAQIGLDVDDIVTIEVRLKDPAAVLKYSAAHFSSSLSISRYGI